MSPGLPRWLLGPARRRQLGNLIMRSCFIRFALRLVLMDAKAGRHHRDWGAFLGLDVRPNLSSFAGKSGLSAVSQECDKWSKASYIAVLCMLWMCVWFTFEILTFSLIAFGVKFQPKSCCFRVIVIRNRCQKSDSVKLFLFLLLVSVKSSLFNLESPILAFHGVPYYPTHFRRHDASF